MVAMPRAPLGLAIQNALMPAPQSPPVSNLAQTGETPKPGFFKEGGMGRIIAGLVGDMLLQRAGSAPVYSQAMTQQQAAEASEAQWHRQRQANREDKLWEWQNKPPEVPAMVQNANAWASMSPEQKQDFQAYQAAGQGDRFVTTSLPNGQFYAGPQSGLVDALRGNQAATPPAAPVGKLTPIQGGPASAPGTFRP